MTNELKIILDHRERNRGSSGNFSFFVSNVSTHVPDLRQAFLSLHLRCPEQGLHSSSTEYIFFLISHNQVVIFWARVVEPKAIELN